MSNQSNQSNQMNQMNKIQFGTTQTTENSYLVLPSSVKKWKCKFRNNDYATIYIKYEDNSIEHRYLEYNKTRHTLSPNWEVLIGKNER